MKKGKLLGMKEVTNSCPACGAGSVGCTNVLQYKHVYLRSCPVHSPMWLSEDEKWRRREGKHVQKKETTHTRSSREPYDPPVRLIRRRGHSHQDASVVRLTRRRHRKADL